MALCDVWFVNADSWNNGCSVGGKQEMAEGCGTTEGKTERKGGRDSAQH